MTGDKKHLLPLGSYAGIPIVSPAGFLAMLEQRDDQECDGPPSRVKR
ncbi:MAG TPA: hypothetical protein VGR16_05470 [Thermomicrobiales bacterium]|nr:hypothetical protein [Thermomicrobiales bacterium]